MNSLNLNGRVAVVTGASRGIGLAVARTLAQHGASLILNARSNESLLDDAAGSIRDEFGTSVHTVLGDVASAKTADQLARCAFETGRRLDICVNNAGILRDNMVGMIPEAEINEVIGSNLHSVIHCTQAAARVMRRSGGGSIINLSSIIGRVGNVGQLVYGASKAGVIGATYSAAKELAPFGIRVNAVAPGFIETDMTKQLSAEKFKERLNSISMGKIGRPEDVANAVLFLASDLSDYVTGQVIGVDGGMLI